MKRIKLAIIGRPNVGKSALFNRICRKNISIVDEEEGITRDRICFETQFLDYPLEVIDTAGIDFCKSKIFNDEMVYQTKIAISESDIIVLVVDGKVGLITLDEKIARLALKSRKKVVLAVNKIDHPLKDDVLAHQFYSLGIENVIAVSALQGYQIEDLLILALKNFDVDKQIPEKGLSQEIPSHKMYSKIAIVGRANVGKSTLFNFLCEKKRAIVSATSGTTRDNVDITIEKNDKNYVLIDTAGIRKKNKEHFVVDKFAAIRTEKAIKRADICLLIIDATEGFTFRDRKIASLLGKEKKGFIVVINKSDQIKEFSLQWCEKALLKEHPSLKNNPMVFISAKKGKNIDKIFSLIELVLENQKKQIATSLLNKFIGQCIKKYNPPMINGKRLRIYYLTQIECTFPLFRLFINNYNLINKTYIKYLKNQFRKAFSFYGTAIEFEIKDKTMLLDKKNDF